MDATTNMEWVSGTLLLGITSKDKENVRFGNNASFQLQQEFHEICREKVSTVVYLLPESQTDKVQPVDAGFGIQMKSALNKWLENEEDLEKWHDKMSAKERRILMTKCTGEAWDDMSKRKDFIR